MLYILFLILLIFLFIAWYTLGKDIFQPSCLVILSFILCAFFAIIMQPRWEYVYHYSTLWIICLGLISIYFGNLIFYKYRLSVFKNGRNRKDLSVTEISKTGYAVLLAIQLVAIIIYYHEILKIVGGGFSLSAIMAAFRAETSYGTSSVSFASAQLLNVSFAICLVSMYVFIKNTLLDGIKGNFKFIIPIILYIFASLMTGGRFSSLIVLCAGLTMFVILYRRIYGHGLTLKIWIWFGVTIAFALICFYLVRELIGRTSTNSQNASFIEYIGSYLGGSLPLFDMYLQDPVAGSSIWGKETFYAINNQLIEWGLLDKEPYITHLEFRSYNGYSLGNVYTGFRRNIQDFGIFGMIVLQFIFSAIMSGAYNKVKGACSGYGMITYCSFAYVLFLHGVNDYFYIRVISFGGLLSLLLIYILYAFMVQKRIAFLNVRLKG